MTTPARNHPWRRDGSKLKHDHVWKGPDACAPVSQSKAWTKAEDRILRRMAGKYSSRQIAAVLGSHRNWNGVRNRAYYLGLHLQTYGEHHHCGRRPAALVEQCRTLHDQGVGPLTIAAQLGVPHKWVEKVVGYVIRRRDR